MPDLSWSSVAAIAGALLLVAYLVGVAIYRREFRRMGYIGWRFCLMWPVSAVGGWALRKAFEREERR